MAFVAGTLYISKLYGVIRSVNDDADSLLGEHVVVWSVHSSQLVPMTPCSYDSVRKTLGGKDDNLYATFPRCRMFSAARKAEARCNTNFQLEKETL
jgi:hypothetical protein